VGELKSTQTKWKTGISEAIAWNVGCMFADRQRSVCWTSRL